MRVNDYIRIEMFASIFEVAIIAALFAWFEIRAQTGSQAILNHFAYWNLVMIPFAITIFSVPFAGAWIREEYGKVIAVVLGDTLLWIMLEDISWHLEQGIWVKSGEWVNWILSGAFVPFTQIWIPTVYIILGGAAVGLYVLGFNED